MTDHVELASMVFFSADPEGLASVLRALGVGLQHEQHGAGEPAHWACEIGQVHVAVYPGESTAASPGLRAGGSVFPGLYVPHLEVAVSAALAAGARPLTGHQWRPWGCRQILRCPGGFSVEVNQKHHCPAHRTE